jgi:hypothetical protein
MFRSSVLCSALVVLLAGCTSSEVKIVKESHLANYPNYLVGQAFDNRHVCSSIDWKSFKVERDRTVVEYTCQYKFAAEYYNGLVSNLVREKSDLFEGAKVRAEMMINEPKEMAAKYQKKLDALKAEPVNPAWPLFIENGKVEIGKLQSIKSFRTYLSAKTQWRVNDEELRIRADRCVAENDETCKRFNDALIETINNIEHSISPQRQIFYVQQAESENQAREFKLQEYATRIESENEEFQKASANKESLIVKAGNERDMAVKKYQDRLSNFQSVNEKIQWAVIDGQPKLAAIFLVIKNKDGEFQRPASPNIVLAEIYKNSVDTSEFHKYLLKEMWFQQK